MDRNRVACLTLIGLAAVLVFWYANVTDGGKTQPVPKTHREMTVAGMNVPSGQPLGAGTPLDMSPVLHFWAPGFMDAGLLDEDHPTVTTRHRYPAVPGGNVSTVMHNGWSQFCKMTPANDDWRLNPPEAAVI